MKPLVVSVGTLAALFLMAADPPPTSPPTSTPDATSEPGATSASPPVEGRPSSQPMPWSPSSTPPPLEPWPEALHEGVQPSQSPTPNAPYRGSVSTDRQGRTHAPIPIADLGFDDARGHWFVIHFAQGWCPTCDDSVRDIDQIASVSKPGGVITLVVTADSSLWKKKVAPDVSVIENPELAAQYEGKTAIVDPRGRVHVLSETTPAPTEVAKVVSPEHVTRDPVRISSNVANDGEHGSIAMTFDVAPGYHVMSAMPTRPEYFALRVNVHDHGPVHVEKPTYPSDQFATSAGDRVSVYSGKFVVSVPYTIDPGAKPGLVELTSDVRYQACSDRVCLFPTDAHPKIVVDVK